MSLYYTPEHAKVGDVIPFFDRRSGRFENFYLKNWNPDAPRDQVVHGSYPCPSGRGLPPDYPGGSPRCRRVALFRAV